jgi:TetR/AcrR family transcriptional regulator, transcriptional repressor for nem operon
MMRRTKQAKSETHARIVAAAARRFRAKGIGGVGIAELMSEAGLTHGGFYAHFGNKDALVAEACAGGMAQSRDGLIRHVRKAPAEQRLARFIALYLSAAHRDHPETGCAMPTLGSEVARAAPEVRAAFTEAFVDYCGELATLFPGVPVAGALDEAAPDAAADEAMVLLAGLAGSMLLARAVDDPALSERILHASKAFYRAAFAGSGTTRSPGDEQPR